MTSEDRDISTVDPTPEESRSSAVPDGADGAAGGSPDAADHESHQETDQEPGRRAGRKGLSFWQESVLLLALAVGLAIVVKALFVQAFYIPSESMEPGLVINDRILVEKPSYWLGGEPQRGDVVVFADPGGWLGPEDADNPTNALTGLLARVGLYPSGGHLVKRVIGTAGDVIECCDAQGRILVNGKPLDEEKYARPNGSGCAPGTSGTCFGPMPGVKRWKAGPVPEGKLFVMGDNRAHSADSSYHLCTPNETECSEDPYVDVDSVVGKVMAVLWPAGKARFEHRPETFAGVPDEPVDQPRKDAGS